MTDRRRFLRRLDLAAGDGILPDLERPTAGPTAIPAGPDLPLVPDIDATSLAAQVRRVLAAAESLGAALPGEDVQALESAFAPRDTAQATGASEAIQRMLDRSSLVAVHINPETRVKVARGPARPALVQGVWRTFLVKVHNEAGTTAALRATSAHRWLDLVTFDDPPMSRTLGGSALEYRIVRLYSHDAGRREASLAFDVGQGTQDLGFRNEVPMLFDCRRAR